jgi:hypothetical protein
MTNIIALSVMQHPPAAPENYLAFLTAPPGAATPMQSAAMSVLSSIFTDQIRTAWDE